MPRDVLKVIEREKVTGLTAVPPLYIQPVSYTHLDVYKRQVEHLVIGGSSPIILVETSI